MVQTAENTFIHGGPFANIAHGCNSIVATQTALKLGDYVVTEAGFGADLGAEKFLDIKCRFAGLKPSAVVIVTTIRALKHHGGAKKDEYGIENVEVLKKGTANLEKQIANIRRFGLEPVIALNRFATDADSELAFIDAFLKEKNVRYALTGMLPRAAKAESFGQGSRCIMRIREPGYNVLYDVEKSIKEKIETITSEIYGADGVDYSPAALKAIKELEENGLDKNRSVWPRPSTPYRITQPCWEDRRLQSIRQGSQSQQWSRLHRCNHR